MLKLRDLEVGSIDGRFEFGTGDDREVDRRYLRAGFVSEDTFDTGRKYFVYGMRGVGKTSLLRWLSSKKRLAGAMTKFILFQSGVTEAERADISRAAGIEWKRTDTQKMEFSQDFKDAWFWFVFHALGEIILEEKAAGRRIENSDAFLSLLGLAGAATIEKTLGWLPTVKNAKVRFKGSVIGLEAELQGDLSTLGEDRGGETTLVALNRRLRHHIAGLRLSRPIYLFIDELEIFRDNQQQYDRDRRMVRDLIFVVSELNELLRTNSQSIYIVAAVRTEILASMRSMGQEVERRVHDRGIHISWDPFVVEDHHPLLEMLRMKLEYSEEKAREKHEPELYGESDVLFRYFPDEVHGQPLANYLLDRSLFRPRDVVQRVLIAKEMFPDEKYFSEEILSRTEQDYSKRLWQEVCYGLSAKYDEESIRYIETLFAGREAYFRLDDVEKRARLMSNRSAEAAKFFDKVRVADILLDLYMFGVVGNSYFAGLDGGGNIRNRWIYRGDQDLFLDRRMVLQQALWKRFDAVSSLEYKSRSGDSGPRMPREKWKENGAPQRKRRRGGRGRKK